MKGLAKDTKILLWGKLAATIVSVHKNGTRYCVALADGTTKFVNAGNVKVAT